MTNPTVFWNNWDPKRPNREDPLDTDGFAEVFEEFAFLDESA